MPATSELAGSASETRPWLRGKRIHWMLTVALTTAFLGVGGTYGVFRFGSIAAAISYVGGARVLVDDDLKDLGDVRVGDSSTLSFGLKNLTGHPVTIQGAQSSCTCAVIDGLPCSIEPGGVNYLLVKVTASSGRQYINGTLSVYTDDSGTPVIHLRYKGRVVVPEATGVGRSVSR